MGEKDGDGGRKQVPSSYDSYHMTDYRFLVGVIPTMIVHVTSIPVHIDTSFSLMLNPLFEVRKVT